ncbi:MAG: hypothetical protein GX938_09675 [Spirochaetales bacterium]|nr:hypothetical protein [Spirochaetales bacterium]
MVKPVEKNFPEDVLKYIKNKKKKDTDVITKVPTDFSGMSTAMEDTVFDKAKKLAMTAAKQKFDENVELIKSLEQIMDVNEDLAPDEKEQLINNINKFKDLISIGRIKKENIVDTKFINKISKLADIPEEQLSNAKINEIKSLINKSINTIKEKLKSDYSEQLSSKDHARYSRLVQSGVAKEKILPFIKIMSADNENNSAYAKMEPLSHEQIVQRLNYAWGMLKEADQETAVKLSVYEPSGQGKGEVFIEFVFDDATSLGGAQSYDISCGNKKYEVKCYNSENDPIRLGTEGKITQFKGYDILYKLYTALQNMILLDDKHLNILKSMLVSASDLIAKGYNVEKDDTGEGLIKFLNELNTPLKSSKSEDEGTVSGESLYEKLRRGEFNSTDMVTVQNVFNTLKIIADAVYENKFEYAKLMNNNEIYTVKNTPEGKYDISENPQTGEVNIKCDKSGGPLVEKKVIEVITELRNCINNAISFTGAGDNENTGEKFLKGLIISISEKITESFREHPMILMNRKVTEPTTAKTQDFCCIGIYTQFVFSHISQSGAQIKVVPAGKSIVEMIDEMINIREAKANKKINKTKTK